MRLWGFAGLGCAVIACSFDPGGAATAFDAASARPDGFRPPRLAMDGSVIVPSADASATFTGTRRLVTLTGPRPATDLTNVPILVVLDSTRIDYTLAGDGAAVHFTDVSGAVFFAHEIERWNSSGRSYVWVKVPTVSASADTKFYLRYGPVVRPTDNAPTGVWSNDYVGVWHLGEDVNDETSGAIHADATGRGNDGVQHNCGPMVDDTGAIGIAQDFDGVDDFIDIDQAGLQGQVNVTTEARVRLRSEPVRFPHVVGGGTNGRYWQIFWERDLGWANRYRVNGVQRDNRTSAGSVDTWSSLASVYDGTAVRLYLDGVLVESDNGSGALDALNTSLYIGDNPSLSPRGFDGAIDELRISSVARSAAWIDLQHRTLTDNLLDFGPAETPQ